MNASLWLLLLAGELSFTLQHQAPEISFRGLWALSEKVVWASGTKGTVLASLDGGATWTPKPVRAGEDLDFRDIHAVSTSTVFVQSAGAGNASRIYRSRNAGDSWELVYENPHPSGFFDGLTFFDEQRGIAYSDPVDGTFFLLETRDGGSNWQRLKGLPPALAGEASFAACGTGIHVLPAGQIWFGAGGASMTRIFRSTDWGKTWSVTTARGCPDFASRTSPVTAWDGPATCMKFAGW